MKRLKRLPTLVTVILLVTLIGYLSISVHAQVQHGVQLKWTLSPTVGVASQNVYRGTVSGGPYTLLTNIGPTLTGYLDPVVDGKTYFYVVTAVSAGPITLESINSNQVTATAPGPIPNPQTGLAASQQ